MLLRGVAGGAGALGIGERKCWELVNRNALPHKRIGKLICFCPRELRWWVFLGCPDAPNAAEKVRAAMINDGAGP